MSEHSHSPAPIDEICDPDTGSLKASRLRKLIDHLPVLIAYIDSQEIYRFSNLQHQHWWGKSEQEIVGRHARDVTSDWNYQNYGGPLRQALAGKLATFDTVARYPGAGERSMQTSYVPDIAEDGRVLGAFVLVTDVTKIKKSEQERKAIFDSAPAYIWYKDTKNRILRINKAAAELLGRSVGEIEGKGTEELYPQHAEKYYQDDLEVVRTGTPKLGIIEQISGRNGEHRWLQTDKVPFFDDDGKIIGVIVFSVDITKQVRAQEERSLLEQQLLESQKMEALGTLAGGIAHDFNNMLAGILGYVSLAKLEVPATGDVPRYLSNIESSATRARDLIQQILTFSRRSTPQEKTAVDVKSLTLEVLSLICATFPSSIQVSTKLPQTDLFVYMNPAHMHQVLLNVATNAAYAMRDRGGELSIELSSVKGSEITQATSEPKPDKDYVHLVVKDSGRGMPEEIRQRIFEPYFTTKPVGDGSGLGLSVVHGIITSSSGTLAVESKLGVGTEFHVYLPRHDPSIYPSHSQDIARQEKNHLEMGSGRILFVDDEPLLAQLGKDLLSTLGYEVVACNSSRAALDLIRATPDSWDIIITDQTMPQMSGDELVRQIRSILPDVPVVLSTGYSASVGEARARECGATAFLVKPYSFEKLASLCSELLKSKAHADSE